MGQQKGSGSLCFAEAPFIMQSASIVGTKEGEGPLKDQFDVVAKDDKFGENTWELAESTLQRKTLLLALSKANIEKGQLRYIFAGDLLGQTMATSFGVKDFNVPLWGLYGACSTCGESLGLAAAMVEAGNADCVAAVTSSHFGSAEKQFRFPLEYANQRPLSATWTVTGSGAFIVASRQYIFNHKKLIENPLNVAITGITTGKIVDYGVKDAQNMGAVMAPAAADLIYQNMMDFNRKPKDYDRIVTGDLGTVGREILIKLLKEKGMDISKNHEDCGIKIYSLEEQNVGAGGSGCGCSASVLSSYYLPMISRGELKRVLFVPTGALLSPVSFNEGQPVPGIAHGVVLEHKSWMEEKED